MSKLIWGGSSANMVPHILPSLHSSLHLKSNTCNVKVEIGQYKRWFTDPYPFFPSIDANSDVKDLKDRTNMPNIFDTLAPACASMSLWFDLDRIGTQNRFQTHACIRSTKSCSFYSVYILQGQSWAWNPSEEIVVAIFQSCFSTGLELQQRI